MSHPNVTRSIAASPDMVWSVLTDTGVLQKGDFGITRLDGDLEADGKIKLWADVSPDRAFTLNVAEFDPGRRMVWRGGMPLGLFTGTRQFNLVKEDGGTLFQMSEDFTGLLSGLITKSMPDLQPSFEKFADALKREAEARST